MADRSIPDQGWSMMQAHLGYTDEEMEMFKQDPRNARVMTKAVELQGKTIVFEVVESRGCNSRHDVGTRFFFSGDGNLISKMAPSRVCAYVLPVMSQAIFGIQELIYADADPDSLCFKRAGCFDVGVQCGGWGHIVIEAKVMDRQEAKALYEQGA